MSTDPRRQHIDHITTVVHDGVRSELDLGVVHDEVEAVYADLERTSKVDAFIPILATRRVRERIEAMVADRSAVAGFVQPGTEPRYRPGDIAHLVDGRFRISLVEAINGTVRYVGHWVDPVEV